METTYKLFAFKHPYKKRLESLQMIRSDLYRAIGCIQILLKPPPIYKHAQALAPLFATALQTQALVSYVRCFSTGRRSALSREVFGAEPEFETWHDEFKLIRDQHVAHSAGPHEHNEIYAAAISPPPVYGCGSYNFFLAGFASKDLKRFLSLCKYVVQHVEKEETRLGNEMAKDLMGAKASWKQAQKNFSKVIQREQLYPTKRS